MDNCIKNKKVEKITKVDYEIIYINEEILVVLLLVFNFENLQKVMKEIRVHI